MEDFKISIKPEGGERLITMGLEALHPGPAPPRISACCRNRMRARFGQGFYLQPYTLDELKSVALRAADALGYMTDEAALQGIAVRFTRHAARFPAAVPALCGCCHQCQYGYRGWQPGRVDHAPAGAG